MAESDWFWQFGQQQGELERYNPYIGVAAYYKDAGYAPVSMRIVSSTSGLDFNLSGAAAMLTDASAAGWAGYEDGNNPGGLISITVEYSIDWTDIYNTRYQDTVTRYYTYQVWDEGPRGAHIGAVVVQEGTTDIVTGGQGPIEVVLDLVAMGDTKGPATVTLVDDMGGRFRLESLGINDPTHLKLVATDASLFDAETLLPNNGPDGFPSIRLAVSDGTTTTYEWVHVFVTNVKPTAPVDADDRANVVGEDAASGSAVGITALATDPNGGIRDYQIVGDGTKYFSVDADGVVRLLEGAENFLNYEKQSQYSVEIRAIDASGDADTSVFVVNVADVNDAPVFDVKSGLVQGFQESFVVPGTLFKTDGLDEGSGTALGRIAATDEDASPGADTLSYSLSGADAAFFTIDAQTGSISFIEVPDYEARANAAGDNAYRFNVVADDGEGGTTAQAVIVGVQDVNEAPTIVSNGGKAGAVIAVQENGKAVTVVAADDPDDFPSLTYALDGGADAAKFRINADTGVLTFIAAPDYDRSGDAGKNNIYDVVVKVSDGTLFDTQTLAVKISNLADDIVGKGGNDLLEGSALGETLSGLAGDDLIRGNGGTDTLFGGLGKDMLSGGVGRGDVFVFDTRLSAANVDTITDYDAGEDVRLDDAIFKGLSLGALKAGQFWKGAVAHDGDDRILYDSASGDLSFDADGSGRQKAVVFAHVGVGEKIAAGDFLVI